MALTSIFQYGGRILTSFRSGCQSSSQPSTRLGSLCWANSSLEGRARECKAEQRGANTKTGAASHDST